MSDPRPIGVLDSGIGGITVLREIRAQIPSERCLYIADSREAPYGSRPARDIERRCEEIVDFLLEAEAKLIVLACNTASVVALKHLRERYAVPFVGVVPGIKPAAAMTRTGKIGVLATPVTAESGPLSQLIEEFAYGATVFTHVSPELVPLVESGEIDGPRVEGILQRHLTPMIESGIDVLVLGCTHYPHLRPAIERMCGPRVAIVETGPAVARQVRRVLAAGGVERAEEGEPPRFFTTGDPDQFADLLQRLAPPDLRGPVEHLER